MSPPKPCTGGLNGGRCDVAVVAASAAGDLPLDALYEILLRLLAKALCRLRAVCRFWRRLLSDPQFAAAHAAPGREPRLVIAAFYSNASEEAEGAGNGRARRRHRDVPGSVASIMDLSGRVVKQVRMDGHRVMSFPFNLACVRSIADGSCRLLDPATYSTTDAAAAMRCYYVRAGEEPIHLFGQVASTGEYKALRKVNQWAYVGEYDLLYEVCTLGSSGGGGGGRPRWRAVQGPPDAFCHTRETGVAIGGVVYLLIADVYFAVIRSSTNPADVQRDWIYSFDLEMEKWLPNIKGPAQGQGFFVDDPAVPPKFCCGFSLANLNGSLVIVHGPSPDTSMDLWFLVDPEKSLRVKKYSIQMTLERLPWYLQPLVVLDDGRTVVVTTRATGLQTLEIYDPRTKSFSTVADQMGRCCAISVYTGNLLSLGRWQHTDKD